MNSEGVSMGESDKGLWHYLSNGESTALGLDEYSFQPL